MTTENGTPNAIGTPEGQSVQQTTEEQFYGKPAPEATTTVTPTEAVVKTVTEVKTETPAQVEFEIKLPENSGLDATAAKEFAKFSKEKGITQEVAQEMFNNQNSLITSMVQKQNETIQNEINQWGEQSRTDKEIGGEKLGESIKMAEYVFTKYGTPELKAMLQNGMGNHPEAIRIFSRIGRELFANDQMVLSKVNVSTAKSAEELFYGSNK